MTARRSRVGAVPVRPAGANRSVRLAGSVRALTRLQRGLLALLVLVLGLLPTLGRVARAQPVGDASALPLTVTVTQLSPTAPQPGDQLDVGGVITNSTALDYENVSIALRVSLAPLTSRSALLAVATSTEHFASVNAGDPVTIGAIGPGQSYRYLFQLPVDVLDLVATGVYRLSVEVFAGSQDVQDYLARVNTFLPWLPPTAGVAPVGVAWVWPMLSTPTLLPNGTFADNSLGAAVAPRGRLGLLLDVAVQAAQQGGTVPEQSGAPVEGVTDPAYTPVRIRPVPVTPVIDPENVEELRLMADPATPYVVDGAPGPSRDAASAYLSRLTSLMTQTAKPIPATIVTPYGDPDLEAMASAGAGSLLTQARSTGVEAGLPGIAGGLLWPPDGALSEQTLDQLTTTGLVLSSKALPVTDAAGLGYTPTDTTAAQRTAGSVPAVVVDEGLSNLAIKLVKATDRVLLAQRFAAETAAIAVEQAPGGRTLVLAPGRRWSPSQSSIRAMLAESGRLPWLTPMTVPQALAQPVDPAVTRGLLHETATSALLPRSTATRISEANAELGRFRSILCRAGATSGTPTTGGTPTTAGTPTSGGTPTATGTPSGTPTPCSPDALVLTLQRSLYRAASTAFRLPQNHGDALLDSTLSAIHGDEAKVRIVTKGDSVLIGSRARIPVSVANGLSVPVTVQLVLRPRNNALEAGSPVTITIPAKGNVQQDITVSSRKAGGGVLYLDAQLLTPANADFGPSAPLTVRVSAAGVVVVTITIAVCSLLALAVVVRIYRRVRNARRPSPEPEPGAGAGAAA